jgi:hypothetical protein
MNFSIQMWRRSLIKMMLILNFQLIMAVMDMTMTSKTRMILKPRMKAKMVNHSHKTRYKDKNSCNDRINIDSKMSKILKQRRKRSHMRRNSSECQLAMRRRRMRRKSSAIFKRKTSNRMERHSLL